MPASDDFPTRLSQIATRWSQLAEAHATDSPLRDGALRALMNRYHGAAYRYLLGITRNADTADELFQEFAIRFLRGDFRGADPERGRFRHYLKSALRRLVIDQHRRAERNPRPVELQELPESPAAGEEFDSSWREELLSRAWQALAEREQRTGTPYHTVLRLRSASPEATAAELAEELSRQLQREFTEAGVRQLLRRARESFSDFLLEDVAASLPSPDRARLEEELASCGLLVYCRSALERRAR